MSRDVAENPFDLLCKDEEYVALKRSLFNYRLRKRKIAPHVPRTGLILDIGSGIAPVSPDLERTVLADISQEAMSAPDLPAKEKVVASITRMPFADGRFDCVLCSEVLEHVEEDRSALSECRRVLKAGGTLVVTVPFQMAYWGEDDDYVGHVRRYEPGDLEEKLRDAGFRTVVLYKLSGRMERFFTLASLRYYVKGKRSVRLPAAFYSIANTVLFLILLVAESILTWRGTTRILAIAR